MYSSRLLIRVCGTGSSSLPIISLAHQVQLVFYEIRVPPQKMIYEHVFISA